MIKAEKEGRKGQREGQREGGKEAGMERQKERVELEGETYIKSGKLPFLLFFIIIFLICPSFLKQYRPSDLLIKHFFHRRLLIFQGKIYFSSVEFPKASQIELCISIK